MFLCDYHTHTRFSFDGDPAATHDAMCRRALEVGLSDIAFTDHCDVNAEAEGLYDTPYDADAAFAAMMEVKEKYKGRLNVVCGIELGNPHQYPAEARAVLDAHPYDFVIGSLHNLRDVPDFYFMKFEDMGEGLIRRLFDRALDETLEAAQFEGITTVGHITYMHRYVTQAGKSFCFKPYYEKLTHLYRTMILRDVALELNVSTLWKGLGIAMPTMELLKLYKDCGGKLITVGTDSHSPQTLGKALRKGYAILETVGFHEVVTVENGQRVLRSIR
jgi:histidinol-phosphatase (PHP family)